MKKALVCLNEPCLEGLRVCQVVDSQNIFAVSDNLMWVACDDTVIADLFYYDGSSFIEKPIVTNTFLNQPTTTGTTTL